MFEILQISCYLIKKVKKVCFFNSETVLGEISEDFLSILESGEVPLLFHCNIKNNDGYSLGTYFEKILIFNHIIPSLDAIDPSDSVTENCSDKITIDYCNQLKAGQSVFIKKVK